MEYILNRGGKPKVNAIPAPPSDPDSLTDLRKQQEITHKHKS